MKRVWQDIKTKNIKPIYLFFGPERFLIEKAENNIIKSIVPNFDENAIEYWDGTENSLDEIVASAATSSLFATEKVVIINYAPWFKNKQAATSFNNLLSYINNPPPQVCLIIKAEEKIDKRLKIVKEIAKFGQVIESPHLRGQELNTWIRRSLNKYDKTIEAAAMYHLTMATNSDLTAINNEIAKLINYKTEKNITLADVKNIVSNNNQLNIFALIDAVANKQTAEAITIYHDLLKQGDSEQMILVMLARQFRLIMQAQSLQKKGYMPKDIASKLAVHPYAITKALQQSQIFNLNQSQKSLEKLLDADVGVKTGTFAGGYKAALEQAILGICLL